MSEPLPQTIGIDISKATLDCHAHPAGIDRQFANLRIPTIARRHSNLMPRSVPI